MKPIVKFYARENAQSEFEFRFALTHEGVRQIMGDKKENLDERLQIMATAAHENPDLVAYKLEHHAYDKKEITEYLGKTLLGTNVNGVDEISQKKKVFGELTDREREIAFLVADGKNAKQISDKLNVSVETIRSHRTHIYDKLGVHKNVELTHFIDEIKPLL